MNISSVFKLCTREALVASFIFYDATGHSLEQFSKSQGLLKWKDQLKLFTILGSAVPVESPSTHAAQALVTSVFELCDTLQASLSGKQIKSLLNANGYDEGSGKTKMAKEDMLVVIESLNQYLPICMWL